MVLHWKGRGRRACEAALGAKEDLNTAAPSCQQAYTSKPTFVVLRYLANVISPQGLEARQRECEKIIIGGLIPCLLAFCRGRDEKG